MKVNLIFVPPGGGEADYSLDFELPAIPQPSDYITVVLRSEAESEHFIVRRTWWNLSYPPGGVIAKPSDCGKVREIFVECEFAIGPYSSDSHRRSAGKNAKEFDNSAY